MANINAGQVIRFEAGGTFTIGTSAVLKIVAGTLRYTEPGRQGIPIRDRGALSGVVLSGDEEAVTGELDVQITVGSLTGASELRSVLKPADTSGAKTLLSTVVHIPDGQGVATGTSITFGKMWTQSLEYTAGGTGEADRLKIRFQDEEAAPTYATY